MFRNNHNAQTANPVDRVLRVAFHRRVVGDAADGSTGADVSTGTVDLGLTVAGADLGLGVDLGLGGSEPATDTDGSTTDTATDTGNTGTADVGGLRDALLRRPGSR